MRSRSKHAPVFFTFDGDVPQFVADGDVSDAHDGERDDEYSEEDVDLVEDLQLGCRPQLQTDVALLVQSNLPYKPGSAAATMPSQYVRCCFKREVVIWFRFCDVSIRILLTDVPASRINTVLQAC